MEMQANYIELVEKARRGDRQSLNQLAAVARERLRVYVYRLTLKEDLTQEIVQESLLEMCRVLGKLKQTDRFWSWLYGIATNKLHRHHRTEKALKKAAASEERRRGPLRERQGGLENLVSQERQADRIEGHAEAADPSQGCAGDAVLRWYVLCGNCRFDGL